MRRREFLASTLGASAALAIACRASVAATRETSNPLFAIAETTAGKLRGVLVDGIYQFRGVPYGASTSGRNRFMPPAPVRPWAGIRNAYAYGEITPQPYSAPMHPFGHLIDFDLHAGAMGEDCLNLNIWTPGLADNGRRPVLVYFHGGGLTAGSANHDLYVGDRLARFADVVVVTVNHRLAAFGYINLTDLGAPEEFADSGMAGILDLVQALEWIRDNIAQFGGDPNCVTIFGQSGGGTKVGAVMAIPRAKGLFHRAAIQSGTLSALTREEASRSAELLLDRLGIRPGQWSKLRTISAEQLVQAQIDIGVYDWISGKPTTRPSPQFSVVIDGRSIATPLTDLAALQNSAAVPLIVGYCHADSGWTESNFDLDDEGLRAVATKLAGAQHVDEALDLYHRAYPNISPFIVQGIMMTDAMLLPRVTELAERKAGLDAAPVWVYRFDWPSRAMGGRFGATHGMDMSLVFHNTHQPTLGGDTDEARTMATKMSTAWTMFARHGDPNNELMPRWRPYTPARRETMVINSPWQRLINDPNHKFREFWARISRVS